MTKDMLPNLLYGVLKDMGGRASIIPVCKEFWAKYENDLRHDLDYIRKDEDANNALNQIRLICVLGTGGKFDYKRIPELNGLMDTVRAGHVRLLEAKRAEILEIIRQCLAEIHTLAGDVYEARKISERADKFFVRQKAKVAEFESLQLLDGLVPQMWVYKDDTVDKIDSIVHPKTQAAPILKLKEDGTVTSQAAQKVIKNVYRQAAFPSKILESQEDIDA